MKFRYAYGLANKLLDFGNRWPAAISFGTYIAFFAFLHTCFVLLNFFALLTFSCYWVVSWRRQIIHYDQPAAIWRAISLIRAQWSPESRLSFCKACQGGSAHLHGRAGRWNDYLSVHTLSQMVIAYSEQIFIAKVSLFRILLFCKPGSCELWNFIFSFDGWTNQSKDSSYLFSAVWSASLAVILSSVSLRKVLAFVEPHFLLPHSHNRWDLKTRKGYKATI